MTVGPQFVVCVFCLAFACLVLDPLLCIGDGARVHGYSVHVCVEGVFEVNYEVLIAGALVFLYGGVVEIVCVGWCEWSVGGGV